MRSYLRHMGESTELPSTAWWYTIQIPAEPLLVSLVRTSLRAALDRHQRLELADPACLLTSELVTNSVVHAKSPVTVRAFYCFNTLYVDVRDYSVAVPAPRDPADGEEAGRGLTLVEACADAWGVRSTDPGKTVWFELQGRRK
jgi:anti-sigma regulatory factor (Ser/Thr protein kinase)